MKTFEKPQAFYPVFERKGGAEPEATHYCPGCGHGVIHKLLAECIDELGIQDRTVMISPVGCSVFAYYYFDTGNVQAAHGRAPAVGTGIKRSRPDSIVISYQGDGDLAAIGGNNILQAANRGENMTVIFVNNAIYGMTGGQLAPTSLLGMKTATTPRGRRFEEYGSPMRVAELLSGLDGTAFSCRHSLTTPAKINKTKRAIKKALQYQMDGKGFSMVEVLSACPTGWHQDPVDSLKWMDENMEPNFPLGVYKDEPHEKAELPKPAEYDPSEVSQALARLASSMATYTMCNEAPWKPIFAEEKRSLQLKAAGFGGQGILLLGELVAKAGMEQGVKVTWLPSYGPEMRGGTANCSVVVSVDDIGNPLVESPDVLVAMNRPSLEKFAVDMAPGGLLVYDSSLIDITPDRDDITVVPVPATKIADDLGSGRAANVVMAGAIVELLGFPSKERLEAVIRDMRKAPRVTEINMKAIEAGMEAAKAEAKAD